MTLYGLLSSLAWAGVVLYIATRLMPFVHARLNMATPERVEVMLPPDLAGYVEQFSTDWAKADAKRAIIERYERNRDWNAVRRSVGLGVM